MKLKKKFVILLSSFLLFNSCAEYKSTKRSLESEKKYFSSNGFALIYENQLYTDKVITKKIDNNALSVIHSFLKKNTHIRITNPTNLKFVETKVSKKGQYPKIFNIVLSKKIATSLDLDFNNPYIEVIEIKKNKTFIAKESNIFDEEKNVAEKAPVEEIEMDDLSINQTNTSKKTDKPKKYFLIINDFYYEESAINLKNELIKQLKTDNFFISKINKNTYRLGLGPFKNFNALKLPYISLNNLGFENLDIYNK